MAKKLLTIREVSQILKVPEGKVVELVEDGKLPAYKIGGEFLRFDVQKVLNLKPYIQKELGIVESESGLKEKIWDFLYFWDFYIASFIIIGLLVFYILKST